MIYEVEILLHKILTSQASRSQRFAQNKYASKSMSKPRERDTVICFPKFGLLKSPTSPLRGSVTLEPGLFQPFSSVSFS